MPLGDRGLEFREGVTPIGEFTEEGASLGEVDGEAPGL